MKTALVTGAATGIGEGLVNKLRKEGYKVFAAYRSSAPDNTSWFGQENVVAVKCDITDEQDIKSVVQQIEQDTGQLDLLLNNAGLSDNCGVLEAPNMDAYRRMMEVNFWGALQTARYCLPLLKKVRGRVINVGSASVYMTIPMGSAYPVSKVALEAMTNHLRAEMKPFGVQATTLHPGGVDTPMAELGDDVAQQQWASVRDDLRNDYRKHFADGPTAIGPNFSFYSPADFADHVYRKVICAKKLRPSYLIGPGSAWMLPYLQRFLPRALTEKIWRDMFASK